VPPAPEGRRRGPALAALAAVVIGAHLWLADTTLQDRLGEVAAAPRLARFEVAFVRELRPESPPPPVARGLARPPRAPRAVAALPTAEAASAATAATAPAPASLPELPDALPEPPPAPALAAASAPALAASAPVPFEWPPSTRLSYRLTGNYRGPVEGQAQVEWLKQGTRYQVHLELGVGPSFAPLVSRRVVSEGDVTADGLRPRRYDEETRALLREPRRVAVQLDDERVRLAGGQEQPRPPGVQDSASQFVQLTWLFTTQPGLLEPGRSVAFPLALPRAMQVWTYDVLAREVLDTPFGPVEAVHVKPRRESRPGGDLVAEVWFAPSLQYLPVRLLIRQDAETHVDLMIERLPQQAAAPLR
jgi:hypothetical protein